VITGLILIILGALLGVVLWKMFQGGAPGARSSSAAASASGPTVMPMAAAAPELIQARPGDVISIPGAAEDFSDLDFTVDRRSAYESMNRRWTDLSGEFRGRRVYLEIWPGSDPQVIGILDPRKLTLPDVGVTEEQLADFDARQDPSAFLTFEGKRWQYEASREVGYYENEAGSGEGLYRWTFRETGGDRLLVIEKWEGEPFEVRIARRLNAHDISVFRAA